MHNKRLGRDDVLKIEVWFTRLSYLANKTILTFCSGLVLPLPLPGVSTLAAIGHLAVTVLLVVVDAAHPRVAVENLILLVEMTVVIVITTDVIVIVPEARMNAIAIVT